jgi:hypothetical protein
MPDDRPQRARAAAEAAEAGTATRDRQIEEAYKAYMWDVQQARLCMAISFDHMTALNIGNCRQMLQACQAHLDELARLIAQRDGYAAAQSIGPDVALPVGGRGR